MDLINIKNYIEKNGKFYTMDGTNIREIKFIDFSLRNTENLSDNKDNNVNWYLTVHYQMAGVEGIQILQDRTKNKQHIDTYIYTKPEHCINNDDCGIRFRDFSWNALKILYNNGWTETGNTHDCDKYPLCWIWVGNQPEIRKLFVNIDILTHKVDVIAKGDVTADNAQPSREKCIEAQHIKVFEFSDDSPAGYVIVNKLKETNIYNSSIH